MKRFLLIAAFLFVGVLTGCDSFKQDSQDDSDGRGNNNEGETTMIISPAIEEAYA